MQHALTCATAAAAVNLGALSKLSLLHQVVNGRQASQHVAQTKRSGWSSVSLLMSDDKENLSLSAISTLACFGHEGECSLQHTHWAPEVGVECQHHLP